MLAWSMTLSGPVQELRLLCFFDAAFATRNDSSSQLGYIIVLIHGDLLKPDGPEGAYHIVDWKSQKTPRVARSSLGAEVQAGGSSSPSNKRPAPSSTTEGMAVGAETALVLFQDEHRQDHPEATMLDPGASAFLSGYGPFWRYVEHLSELGYPMNTIRFARCERNFQFGGDASSSARWTVDLPVIIDGQYGTIQCCLIPGNTSM